MVGQLICLLELSARENEDARRERHWHWRRSLRRLRAGHAELTGLTVGVRGEELTNERLLARTEPAKRHTHANCGYASGAGTGTGRGNIGAERRATPPKITYERNM